MPLTLGHEGAGVVDALGDGATAVALDISEAELALASEVGAHHVLRSDPSGD